MQALLKQNIQLKQQAEQFGQQVNVLKQKGLQHQNQMETLLKFNEKLLHIIEKQLNHQKISNSDIMSLHPISQKTELQSEMFQSQLTNNVFGSLMAQKRSHQFVSTNPMRNLHNNQSNYEKQRTQPMANIQRQQQLSIVVDGERQFKDEDWQSQVHQLIAQFRRPIFPNKSITQIQQQIKQQLAQFNSIKTNSKEYYETRISKLLQIKQNFIDFDCYNQLEGMIDNLETEEKTKKLLKEYLEEL